MLVPFSKEIYVCFHLKQLASSVYQTVIAITCTTLVQIQDWESYHLDAILVAGNQLYLNIFQGMACI